VTLERSDISYAGMTSFASDGLGRPDGYGTWSVPSDLRLDGDLLVWSPGGGEVVTGRADMLESFACLPDQSDAHLLGFARRWGVLNICEHGLPASHFPRRFLQWIDEEGAPSCDIAPGVSEPVDAWRRYAGMAQAILNIAARLVQAHPEPAPAEAWLPLTDFVPGQLVAGVVGGDIIPEVPRRRLASASEQQRLLARVVQQWLLLGDVQVQFTYQDRPHFDLGNGNLFGAIGLQLALAVAKREGLAICDECGRFFVPRRQNKPGTPRRCPRPACRERAAKRDSARRRRAREREAQK